MPRCELVYLLFLNKKGPLNILTRFYECLLNPRSAIFEKKRKRKKEKTLFETFVQICNLLYTQISVSGGPWNIFFFLDGGPQPKICNFGGP